MWIRQYEQLILLQQRYQLTQLQMQQQEQQQQIGFGLPALSTTAGMVTPLAQSSPVAQSTPVDPSPEVGQVRHFQRPLPHIETPTSRRSIIVSTSGSSASVVTDSSILARPLDYESEDDPMEGCSQSHQK